MATYTIIETGRDADRSPLYAVEIDGARELSDLLWTQAYAYVVSCIRPGDVWREEHVGAAPVVMNYAAVQEMERRNAAFDRGEVA